MRLLKNTHVQHQTHPFRIVMYVRHAHIFQLYKRHHTPSLPSAPLRLKVNIAHLYENQSSF